MLQLRQAGVRFLIPPAPLRAAPKLSAVWAAMQWLNRRPSAATSLCAIGAGTSHILLKRLSSPAAVSIYHELIAPRKLLLHKSEIRKLAGLAAVKGHALLPLAFYWKNGKVKVALAVGKGKQHFDKREELKRRESERELKRAQMHRFKGK